MQNYIKENGTNLTIVIGAETFHMNYVQLLAFLKGKACDDYLETYYEIVARIEAHLHEENGFAYDHYCETGTGGLYELAKELTDKFQKLQEGREWDGGFLDEIDNFWAQECENRKN